MLEPRGVGIGLGERIREVGQALHPVQGDVLLGLDTADGGDSRRYPSVPDGIV